MANLFFLSLKKMNWIRCLEGDLTPNLFKERGANLIKYKINTFITWKLMT